MIFILFLGFFYSLPPYRSKYDFYFVSRLFYSLPFYWSKYDFYIVSRLICRDAIKTGGRKTARWVIWSFFRHSSFGSGALRFRNR